MKTLHLFYALATLACGCSNHRVTQTENPTAQTGSESPTHKRAEETIIASASFDPDGRRIVTTSADGSGKVWDAATGRLLTGRYQPDVPDNMPIIGGDHFQQLQDQIVALEKRVKELEKKTAPPGR